MTINKFGFRRIFKISMEIAKTFQDTFGKSSFSRMKSGHATKSMLSVVQNSSLQKSNERGVL
jgi:hypothetical protein